MFKEKTEDTPEVIFNDSMLSLKGRSIPEDVIAFYKEILDKLSKHEIQEDFLFKVELEYFNTSSSKVILDILSKLEEKDKNKNILVEWHCIDDEDMFEAATEYSELVDLKFTILK